VGLLRRASRAAGEQFRTCRFEQMEPRRLLSASFAPIQIGAVYFEDKSGGDETGEVIEIHWTGGAPGTQLTALVIEGDKLGDGPDGGDAFFDTLPAEPGASGAVPLGILDSTGIDSVTTSVVDGGTTLAFAFAGFDPGEKLVFTVDVDEQGYNPNYQQDGYGGPNAFIEGKEFEGSLLTATFEADHYETATGWGVFRDDYDDDFQGSLLDLPANDYVPPGEVPRPIQTAGAIVEITQTPLPITIAGTVFEDIDLNNVQQGGEPGIGGVELALLKLEGADYVDTALAATTDSQGDYQFGAGVLPGTYRVVETQPAGYFSVGATAGKVNFGTPQQQTRGVVAGADVISEITLLGGEDSVENNFAEARPAALSGHVYHDADDDGLFDAQETGIGGVLLQVQYLPPQGMASAPLPVYSLPDGSWSAENLMPGQYRVTEVQPAGYYDGQDTPGDAGGMAHNPGDLIDGVQLAGGQLGTGYNFGELAPAGISGYVYLDSNQNGDFDSGESGLANVELALLRADGSAAGQKTTTDSTGFYQFVNLMPATYGVAETQPAGYYDGLDTAGDAGGMAHNPGDLIDGVQLASGQLGTGYNFGEILLADLAGYVYADDDDDGWFDPQEQGIAGAAVAILAADGSVVKTTVSGPGGAYRFEDLTPGTYSIVETQPAGFYDGLDTPGNLGGIATSPPGDRIANVRLKGGARGEDYNFGELRPASISGRVYVEVDRDCTFDPGEPVLAGVTVRLLDAQGQQFRTTTTDDQGRYAFADLPPGQYKVEEVQPAGYFQGNACIGSQGGRRESADLIGEVVLGPGVDATDYNFCELLPASISGHVFQDGETILLEPLQQTSELIGMRDGKLTADDTPIAGVVLRLGDASGVPILDSLGQPVVAVTNAQGYYQFTMLAPDNRYTILQEQPGTYIDGIDTPGTHGGTAVNPGTSMVGGDLGQLAVDPRNDAIVGIYLGSGDAAADYNFSEIAFRRMILPPPPPAPPPTPDPPPQPILRDQPAAPTAGYYPLPLQVVMQPLFGGSCGPQAYTWHLSIIDGGHPRGRRNDPDTPAKALRLHFDPDTWTGDDLDQVQWTFAGSGGVARRKARFGLGGAIPVSGDFDGDGVDEIGVFLDGVWFIDLNGNGVWDRDDLWAELGNPGDLPVVGDWDGDGKADIGTFGPQWPGDERALAAEAGLPDADNLPDGRFKNLPPEINDAVAGYRTMQHGAGGDIRADVVDHVFKYGAEGDRPVTGDWNGDGVSNIGIFRQGTWFLDVDGNGRWSEADERVRFGAPGDVPVVGDFNSDGTDELGVYRAGTWIFDTNGNRSLDANDKVFELGGPGDKPTVGDFDGDGVDEPAVYHDEAA